MVRTLSEAVVEGLRVSDVLFQRYVADLKPTEWHFQPVPGMNTVAWVVGHLTLVEHRRATALGATGLPDLPAGFAERYGPTRQPAGAQPALDSPAELTRLFHAVRDRLRAAVREATPERLAAPLAPPHPLFATVGEATLFLPQHAALHFGQVTVLRRILGYPPVL